MIIETAIQTVSSWAGLVADLHRTRQTRHSAQHLARIGAQLALPHLTSHRVKGMPSHRPGVHIQPDERTLIPH